MFLVVYLNSKIINISPANMLRCNFNAAKTSDSEDTKTQKHYKHRGVCRDV